MIHKSTYLVLITNRGELGRNNTSAVAELAGRCISYAKGMTRQYTASTAEDSDSNSDQEFSVVSYTLVCSVAF